MLGRLCSFRGRRITNANRRQNYLLLPVALLLGGSYTNYYRTTTNLPEVTDCTGIDW